MADVNTVIEAANELFKLVPGIKRVYKEAPNVAPSADLPCVIPISSSIAQSDAAQGYQRKDYTIKYLLLVAPYSRNLNSMEKQARPLADPVMDLFFQHGCLGTDPEIIDHATMDIGNYDRIEYNEVQEYLGWVFTLRATLKQELERGF